MGTALVVQARQAMAPLDSRLVDLDPMAWQTWLALLTLADDQTATYSLGWDELRHATDYPSERTLARRMAALVDVGLVTPLPRIPGAFRAYLLHP